ncbi:MAG: hypothetical protein E7328_03655 [Clostridiales bacterium]|nr:hypothetical protein [Clostridiales bacterium]
MIKTVTELPITESSYPFAEARRRSPLKEKGFVEKEYLFTGTSNVYRTNENGEVEVEFSDAPYTNRMVVRCPEDPTKFSGHVVVEILNASGKFDIERMWIISSRYFLNHGIAYVGITSKPDVFDALKRYDSDRYGAIAWDNPRPEADRLPPLTMPNRMSFVHMDQECGLFWDMLTDTSRLLRSKDEKNPLKDHDVKYVTLTGWSQSSCYAVRYINSFAYRDEVKKDGPIFDGYFNAGQVYSTVVPVNQQEYHKPFDASETVVHHMEQPFIIVQTESELNGFGAGNVPRHNSDVPGNLLRLYEIPGSTHDNKPGLVDYYKNDPKLNDSGIHPSYHGEHEFANDFPYDYPMNAAYDHLFKWIETGAAPRPMPRFELSAGGLARTDAFGNAMGGVRTAFVDVPTCRYIPWSNNISRTGVRSFSPMFGHLEPFSPAMLKELYGDLKSYEAKVREATMIHVEKGYVLKEEAELIIAQAVKDAKERGLN